MVLGMRIGENQQLLNLEASDMMHYIGLVEDVGHGNPHRYQRMRNQKLK